jgi:hypothetical protein
MQSVPRPHARHRHPGEHYKRSEARSQPSKGVAPQRVPRAAGALHRFTVPSENARGAVPITTPRPSAAHNR